MYKNLVLAGGGVHGYAYVGVIEILEGNNYLKHFKNFAGNSIGAAIATLLACKADTQFIKQAMMELNPSFLQDGSCFLRNLYRLYKKYGYFKGDYAYQWFSKLLEKLTGNSKITFAEAHKKYGNTLVIVGTSLTTKSPVYFSHQNYPNMEIRLAVRISVSVPIIFKAIKWNNDIWVDGGITDNFPITYFDSDTIKKYSKWVGGKSLSNEDTDMKVIQGKILNFHQKLHQTLGIDLLTHDDFHNKREEINNIVDFTTTLLDTMLENNCRSPLNKFNEARTVRINAGDISSMNFNIKDNDKIELINRGISTMQKYIDENEEKFTKM